MQSVGCAIDFGTSNSSVALVRGGGEPARGATHRQSFDLSPVELVALDAEQTAIPTAVFFNGEDGAREFGRAALQAYVDGHDGRLMRSIKSILGSDLIERTTEVGPGVVVRYFDVVVAFLQHLRLRAEVCLGAPIGRAVIGRPVFFVDDDPARDAQAQRTLASAATVAGFREVEFQFEPIAAALDYERTVSRETLVLVADIGGGTSDFSVVRVGPLLRDKVDRSADVLANHGVHVAGTDFDREVNLAAIMPSLGLGSPGRSESGTIVRVPNAIYHALATWHLINTVYVPNRLIELRQMASLYVDAQMHRRLMTVLEHRLGHALAASAEAAKIEVALHDRTTIDLAAIETGLAIDFDARRQQHALSASIGRIANAARVVIDRAGLAPAQIDALYFTGGSTGLDVLTEAVGAVVPGAERVAGNRFTSVVSGLAVDARRRFAER
ncbi:MAG: Hsp70 family protein [Proteobacteria bacterium]|nr:Hsp70 family protein [Burkholderiales bacterium]